MVNPFAKPTANTEDNAGKKVIITPPDPATQQAIDEYVEAKQNIDELTAVANTAKECILAFALDKYFEKFAESQTKPDNIFQFAGQKEKVSLTVQDKGGDKRYKIKDPQVNALKAIIGEGATDEILEDQVEYKFNNKILEKEGVMDRLIGCMNQMAKDGLISEKDVSNMIDIKDFRTAKKGTLSRLATLCQNKDQMFETFSALGSSVSAYIK